MTSGDLETRTRTEVKGRSAPSATTGVRPLVGGVQRIEMPVSGLTCERCVQAVEAALRAVPGVNRATVNLVGGRAFIEYDPRQATLTAIHDAIKATGYRSETAKTRFKKHKATGSRQ